MDLLGSDIEVWWWSFFWSATFFGELKIGIPYALYNGMDPWIAYLWCCFANTFSFPITIWFLDTLHHKFMLWAPYRNWIGKILRRTREKTVNLVRKYGYLGIAMFVMFPLPMTGAYIGSMACWVFDMDRKRSFIFISGGSFFAGAVLMILIKGGIIAVEAVA